MERLAIVVPCYNEQEVFTDTVRQLTSLLQSLIDKQKISANSYLLFVNDGSTDDTWPMMCREFENNPFVYAINLAANVGQQKALFAGLMEATCDMAISIDADLQDDIGVIEEMIDKYYAGADIVYGVRSSRETDTFLKKFTAQSFYKLMSHMGVKSIYNHADYRLMSARALHQLSLYKERNLFLRGVVPTIGYHTECVYYERKERTAGESKYPLQKMLALAFDGITSFSIKPITMVMMIGVAIIVCSIAAYIYILISYFCFSNRTVAGWASIMTSIWFLGGLQLFAIGVIGEYVGKTYMEVKERPRYNIECFLRHDLPDDHATKDCPKDN